MTRSDAVNWFRRELDRRDTGDDETGAYTLAITALLRSIKSTRMAKKNAIARRREAREPMNKVVGVWTGECDFCGKVKALTSLQNDLVKENEVIDEHKKH